MPARIRPNRLGYSEYDCVGIGRPCLDDMAGTAFECLPKCMQKMVQVAPYQEIPVNSLGFDPSGLDFDPLKESGIFVDLATDLLEYLDLSCTYAYACNTPGQGIQSEHQVQYEPGFMDPKTWNLDMLGGEGGGGDKNEGEVSGVDVTVVTDLYLDSQAILNWDRCTIKVLETGGCTGLEAVPGWQVTDCDDAEL